MGGVDGGWLVGWLFLGGGGDLAGGGGIGRAKVLTPVTENDLVSRLFLKKKNMTEDN